MKNTIVLVMPRTGPLLLTPPFGLMSLAARLEEKGFKAKIIDSRLIDYHHALSELLSADDIILVGITSMTGPQIAHGLKISRFVKSGWDIPIVWGGIHPSFMPVQTVTHDYIDYVVQGFGENALPEVAESIRERGHARGIGGVWYEENGNAVTPKPRSVKEIKEFPTYAWHLVDPGKYILKGMVTDRTLSLFSSRGCPHRCSFCYGPAFHKRRWIAQPAEDTLEEIDRLRKRADFDGVYFHDDNFAVDRKRVMAIGRGLAERGIKYRFALRSDYITEDLIRFLKEHNCAGVDWGADSGSPAILEEYQKDTTVEQTIEGAKLLAKYGLSGQVGIMIGHPRETMEDINLSLDLMDEIKRINPALKIGDAKIATPYPGSGFYYTAIEHGFEPPQSLEEWSNFYWNSSKMPWIRNRKEIEIISFTSLVVFMHWRLKRNKIYFDIPLEIMHRIEKIRWRKRFWKFAWEIRFLKYLMDINLFFLRKEIQPLFFFQRLMEKFRKTAKLPVHSIARGANQSG